MENLLLFICLLLIHFLTVEASNSFEAKVCDNSICNFHNLAVDSKTGSVFIGARNRLYQLSSDLSSFKERVTGYSDCYNINNCVDPPNLNKILIIDKDFDRLIACGNKRELSCSLFDLSDINIKYTQNVSVDKCPLSSDNVTQVAILSKKGVRADSTSSLYFGSSKTIRDCPHITNHKTRSSLVPYTKLQLVSDSNAKYNFEPFYGFFGAFGPKYKVNSKLNQHMVAGFEIDDALYFITMYSLSTSKHLKTYITRFCNKPDHSTVQFELEISCYNRGINYGIASTAHFMNMSDVDGHSYIVVSFYSEQEPGSAACIYKVGSLENTFRTVTKNCSIHVEKRYRPIDIPWTQTTDGRFDCGDRSGKIQHELCSEEVQFKNLQSAVPFVNDAFYFTDSTRMSSLQSIKVSSQYSVIFIGTENGQLLKVRLNMETLDGFLYESIHINTPIKLEKNSKFNYNDAAIISLDINFNNLQLWKSTIYVLSRKLLVYKPVENCSKYTSCSACVSSNDPHCGWCTLENKCTVSRVCKQSSEKYFYISFDETCPKIQPRFHSKSSLALDSLPARLELKVSSVPQLLSGRYFCLFNDYFENTTTLYRRGNETLVQCITPKSSELSKAVQQILTLDLLYISSTTRITVATTSFNIFQCPTYNSCFSCLQSAHSCKWCSSQNTCTYRDQTCRRFIANSEKCPVIYRFANNGYDSEELNKTTEYIYSEKRRDLVLETANVDSSGSSFVCVVETDNKISQETRTKIQSSKIICLNVLSQIKADGNVAIGKLSVVMKKNGLAKKAIVHQLAPLSIEMFDCGLGEMNNSCGNCLQSNENWNCGWCSTSNTCTLSKDCVLTDWVKANGKEVCSFPKINGFYPKQAVIGADTMITLEGENFDPRLRMKITVAGLNCIPFRLVGCCKLQCHVKTNIGMISSKELIGNISLCITTNHKCRLPLTQFSNSTKQLFYFVRPIVESVVPDVILNNWGSTVTISGKYLDADERQSISIGGQDCVPVKTTSNELVCRLSCLNNDELNQRFRRSTEKKKIHHQRHKRHFRKRSRRSHNSIKLIYGDYMLDSNTNVFLQTANISNVTSVATYQSGGTYVDIHGSNLHLIDSPTIILQIHGIELNEECFYHNDTKKLKCLVPSINRYFNSPHRLDKKFIITSGNRCFYISSSSPLQYYPNPILNLLRHNEKYSEGKRLYISGSNICPGGAIGNCRAVNIDVFVGGSKCEVMRVTNDEIQCLLKDMASGTHRAKVVIGGYETVIGDIVYAAGAASIPMPAVIVIIAMIIILIIIVILVCSKFRKKIQSRNQEVINWQLRLNRLESEVVRASKEGFAELQTDLNHQSIEPGVRIRYGTPYHDYRIYLIRVLFPDPDDSDRQMSLLLTNVENGNMPRSNRRKAIEAFRRLIFDKKFIHLFIRTLESQKSFSMKDRANVAGLVLIVLQDHLAYATEILEVLLSELISKGVEKDTNPKLLFRRTESVAEKMLTHWFSMLLYSFLVDCAGDSLFTLYRALCLQIDKGPVDAITNDAKYSLSEDKLLRQSVDPRQVSLKVFNSFDRDSKEFTMEVLNCDSISQVKRKILDVAYGNVPYSQRIHPHKVDLELQYAKANILLRDEDISSVVEGEWKKVNTIEHYKITNDSKIVVIPKKTVLSSIASSNNRLNISFSKQDSTSRLLPSTEGSLPRHKQPVIRPETPSTNDTCRFWHLVKPSDQEAREGKEGSGSKMVAEVYLTRLLQTKRTLQKYVDDLFETIFSVQQRGGSLPPAVKHMFDFLDQQARAHNISDKTIVHTWKTNCLPLRFWVNLIKNPEFVYDIYKSSIVDSCLSVVGQTFMDSCAIGEITLTKDSPSNKLLYACDVPKYKKWVSSYYSDISRMAQLERKHWANFLDEESTRHSNAFNSEAALSQLFHFVEKFSNQIHDNLKKEGNSKNLSEQLNYIESLCRNVVNSNSNGASLSRRYQI